MTTTYEHYDLSDDRHEDGYFRPSRKSRKHNPGKDSRAIRQARFQKETGCLSRHDAEAAQARLEELLTA